MDAVADLKKKRISSSFKNILDRLNSSDELEKIIEETLTDILVYSCETEYLGKSTYNSNISYRINDKVSGSCDLCGESLFNQINL